MDSGDFGIQAQVDSAAGFFQGGQPGGGGEFKHPCFAELAWKNLLWVVAQHQLDDVALGSAVERVDWAFGGASVEAAEAAVHGSGDGTAETIGGVDQEDICPAFV